MNQPPQQPKTVVSQMLTVAVQKLQARANFAAFTLRPGARVPSLRIEVGEGKEENYPLLGDRYILGRSSRACDIVVANPVVSQTHCVLERDKKNSAHFVISDENSTNGIYSGKKRVKSLSLRHGDSFTLAPPDLANAVKIQYYNPPPLWAKTLEKGLYGAGGLLGVLTLWMGYQWSRVSVYPLPGNTNGPVVVYARDGQTPLHPLREETHQELKNLRDFSPFLPKALLASEDSRFYWHFGVDPLGIARALMVNWKTDDIRQGASTITQQLARSLFPEVGREDTAARKLREMAVALKLETFYSKDELLKTYLNRVYLGNAGYGFEDASQFYFDKSAKNLNLSEAATLVAMLPSPNRYNPVQNYDTAVQLRNRILNRMVSQGMVTPEEAARARRSRIEVSPKAQKALSSTIAPYFYSYVFREIEDLLGEETAKEGNFIVETSLDPELQVKAEKSLKNKVYQDGSIYRFHQGALVTLDTRTGEILTLVGGVDYSKSQFDRATQAKRQPGSTFKAFAYAGAIANGVSPYKIYSCNSLFWRGQTYKPCERSTGDIDMFRGFALSENAVSLRVGQDAGLDNIVNIAHRLGVKSYLKSVPGLVLGQSEVTVLEMTGAYATFANNGVWNRPHSIKRILDGSDCKIRGDNKSCRVIYDYAKDADSNLQVISPAIADTMTRLMQGVITNGTGRAAYLGQGEAGKTGTTNNYVDLWFIGFIPGRHLVTGVWLGNDDNKPTGGTSGEAAKLWGNYMRQALD
ncbi:MAG: Biosynthetic peptidoglycan transglycosylase [Chroococcopsis gigantea SAG 12.99]|jgi:penicillin-binding protein 1A|nr:Biosynthetic peptidoglycan transglycosylase [Chroococcopsis gigantea SAG 12.99]